MRREERRDESDRARAKELLVGDDATDRLRKEFEEHFERLVHEREIEVKGATKLAEEAHEALSAVAKQQGATASRLVGSVSRHVLPETASFANLAALQASARGCQRASTYIATSSNELVFSCKLTAPTANMAV